MISPRSATRSTSRPEWIGHPHRPGGVQRDPIGPHADLGDRLGQRGRGGRFAKAGPHPPAGQRSTGTDGEGRQPLPGAFRDDQGAAISRQRLAVRQQHSLSHDTGRAVRIHSRQAAAGQAEQADGHGASLLSGDPRNTSASPPTRGHDDSWADEEHQRSPAYVLIWNTAVVIQPTAGGAQIDGSAKTAARSEYLPGLRPNPTPPGGRTPPGPASMRAGRSRPPSPVRARYPRRMVVESCRVAVQIR